MSDTIYLFNQVSRRGHLDLYARLYSRSLIRLGYRVVLIEEQDSRTAASIGAGHGAVPFVSLTRAEIREPMATPAMAARLQSPPGAAGLRFVLRRGRKLTERVVAGAARRWRRVHRRPETYEDDRYLSGFDFTPLVDEVRAAEFHLGYPPALVLFLYLDMMNENPDGLDYLERHLPVPWAGILFHPSYSGSPPNRPEDYFGCHNCRGAAFLNPAHVPVYQRRFPTRVFWEVPDVTDAALPCQPSALARRLRERAGGRALVLLVGTVGMHKCVLEFVEMIRRSDPARYFFAIVGAVNWDTFGSHQDELRRFYAAPPENCLAHEGYLPDEAELNAAIAESDVIYAVYRDFHNSSNSLTKAALFEKPIIVSAGCLMGERVSRYRIGTTVSPGDVVAAQAALDRVCGAEMGEFGFADYARDHSLEALERQLADIVPRWLGRKGL